MTANHPLRRLLVRVCSPETMSRVVDPTLADVRWESGRLTVRSHLILAKALLVHTALSTPGVLSRAWSDDDRAIPKVVGFALMGAAIGALLLEVPYFREYPNRANRDASLIGIALLLAPQALVLTFPPALLLAIPLAFRQQRPSGRLTRRTIALSLCCVVATFVLVMWVMPETNQAFRVLTSGQHDLPRGPAEEGLATMRERLRERIEDAKHKYGGQAAARRLEFDYHVRLMLPWLPLPLGAIALAIARSGRGRRRPWLMGLAALAGYLFLYWPFLLGASTLVGGSSLPPPAFAWMPTFLLATGATVLLRRVGPEPA